MGIKDRVRTMGFGLPDISGMQNQLNEKFEQLIAELHTMQGTLGDILAELRTQRGAPR